MARMDGLTPRRSPEAIAAELREKLILLEAELAFLGPEDAAEKAGYEAQIAEVRQVLASLDLLG